MSISIQLLALYKYNIFFSENVEVHYWWQVLILIFATMFSVFCPTAGTIRFILASKSLQ